MDLQYTDEQFADVLREFTYDEQSDRQSTVTSGPNLGVAPSGTYNIDLDGAHPSLFETPAGPIYQPPGGFQEHSSQGHIENFSSNSITPGPTLYYTTGLQETTLQTRIASSSLASIHPILTPATPNPPRDLSSTTASATSLPPIPAGLNPQIIAGALQAATTAPPSQTYPTVPWPTTTIHPAPQSQQLLHNPQYHGAPTTMPTQIQMPIYPPPPPPQYQPETLSDYPHLHRTHYNQGYREGIAHGRQQTSQAGFDAGFRLSRYYSFRVGKILGLIEAAFFGRSDDLAQDIYARAQNELDVKALVTDVQVVEAATTTTTTTTTTTVGGVTYGTGASNPHPPHTDPSTGFPAPATTAGVYIPTLNDDPTTTAGLTLAQPPPTMLRYGPPNNFSFDGANNHNNHIYAEHSMYPLTPLEALNRWEGFAITWMRQQGERARAQRNVS